MTELLTAAKVDVESARSQAEGWTAQEVIEWTANAFGSQVALSTSFQADGMVILDIAHRMGVDLRVATIDTGRMPPETYNLIDAIRERYDIPIETYLPDHNEVSDFLTQFGANAFYNSVSLRLLCCQIRKTHPMEKLLEGLDAWIAGVRRSHSATRRDVGKIEIDDAHGGIVKVNPLADWTDERVWAYIKANDVPYNKLYDIGYTSIGCAPCTRPISAGEDTRAGRWWWEDDSVPKECGIHMDPGWAEEVKATS